MKTRPTARAVQHAARHTLRLAGITLTLAASSCSSSDDPRTSSSALVPPNPDAEGTPGDEAQPPPETGDDPTPMDGNTSTPSSADGPQVTDVAGTTDPESSGSETPPDAEEPDTDEPSAEGLPAVPSAGCGTARTLQDGIQTITSGGVSRQYFLATAGEYDENTPRRVVFMFHWNYGSINAIVNPPDADQNTDRPFYGFGDLTDDGTIFVVPQGLISPTGGAGWENPNNRDVVFTDDMLEAISADLCVDTSRVFTTGFSYGAGMSLALACTRPDKFRAAAVYQAGFISGVGPAACTTPVAFFASHGVDDPIISYATGLNVIGTFATLNGCTAMTPPEPSQDGHTCVSYEGCALPTRFCNFGAGQGNPHNPSLSGHYPSAKDPGQSTSWIPAEAWAFITQF